MPLKYYGMGTGFYLLYFDSLRKLFITFIHVGYDVIHCESGAGTFYNTHFICYYQLF